MQTLLTRKKIGYLMLIGLLSLVNTGFKNAGMYSRDQPVNEPVSLYDQLHLDKAGLSREVFARAMSGFTKLHASKQLKNDSLLTIADLSQSANSRRLYVIDLIKKTLLFNTFVSHGRNSGEEYANSFANKPESFKSSLGFYITGETYNGAHGVSMRLKGIEEGINHNAEQRGIVVHGADYVSETFIKRNGRLGRSQGCPAVPAGECKPIVDRLNSGSCFFIFYPDSGYLKRSKYIN